MIKNKLTERLIFNIVKRKHLANFCTKTLKKNGKYFNKFIAQNAIFFRVLR